MKLTIQAKQKVESCLPCPECGEYSFSWGYLKVGESFGPWYCEDCGLGIQGDVTDEGACIERASDRKLNTLVLLCLYEPLKGGEDVHIVVKGMTFVKEGEEPDFDHDVYFYNEHTCPWNYLRLPLKAGEDTDPHGVFVHQETVLMPKDYDEDQSFDDIDGWKALFPSLRKEEAA